MIAQQRNIVIAQTKKIVIAQHRTKKHCDRTTKKIVIAQQREMLSHNKETL